MRQRYLSVLILACAGCAPAEERLRVSLGTRAAQSPPVLRAEGHTELMPDGVVTLSGGTPTPAGLPIPTSTICFAFVSPVEYTITSRILPVPGNDGQLFTEALLVIGDPPPEEQLLCEAPNNNCVNYAGPGSKSNKNVFRAKLMNCPLPLFQGLALVWENVPVDPPGTTGTRTYRLTNIRVDAASAKPSVPVQANLLIGNIAEEPQQAVMGPAQRSLDFSVRNVDSTAPLPDAFQLSQCAVLPPTRIGTLRFAELFPGAFRRRSPAVFTTTERSPDPVDNADPVHPFTTETGFYNHRFSSASVQPGLADHGTRVRATFKNIPVGATIFVDTVNSSQTARLIAGHRVPFVPFGPASGKVPLEMTDDSSATAVWEVLGGDTTVTNNLEFGVYLDYSPQPDSPPDLVLPNITVQGGYAPPAGWAQEIPSFADTSTAVPLVRFGPCGLVITTTSPLPPGAVGAQYSLQLNATGGVAPGGGLTWASTGALPPGLSLDAAGLLSGTPTMPGPPFCFVATVTSGSLRTGKTLCIRISDLHILTKITFPVEVVVGRTPPLDPLVAAGGTPPYTWSIVKGSLPRAITLNTDGTFAGQALDPVDNSCVPVTLQVSDASIPPASLPVGLCLDVLGQATVKILGLPDGVAPNGMQGIQVMLQDPYPRNINVKLTANFQAGAVAVPLNPGVDDPDADDSEVGFPGGTTMTFQISMGSTLGPLMTLRTGTVAGDITISASADVGGALIGTGQKTTTVPLMRPAITDLKIQPRTGGFDVCVTGFATNREVTSATFDFQPAPGAKLQGNLVTVPVGPVFEAAYRQEGSGVFVYVQSFQVQGSILDIAAVTVTLANSRTEGAPEIATRKAIFADFPTGSVCPPPI
jgi:hypothetical protein